MGENNLTNEYMRCERRVNKRSYWPQGKHENKYGRKMCCAQNTNAVFVRRRGIRERIDEYEETNSKCSSRIDLVVSKEIGAGGEKKTD